MNGLNELLQELGISKVKLAKYLGVSRQMVYNYLEIDDLNKWPKDKKIRMLKLLDIKGVEDLKKVNVTTEYMMKVDNILDDVFLDSNEEMNREPNLDDLKIKEQELLNDIIFILKEKLLDSKSSESYITVKYLYHFLQALDSVKELKYLLGYVAKSTGFVNPNDFVFDADGQFIFESIIYSAMTLYNNGGASRSKVAESHRKFVSEIEHKTEEKLSRTQELNTVKVQALKELGYTVINENNAAEVFEKIAEIQARKIV